MKKILLVAQREFLATAGTRAFIFGVLVTPVLMGITQFISQKMTPTSADPSQAKMMLIMPFVMTIFFMNFQSGLVLYWLTTNVLQIGQQAIMNRMMHRNK